MSKYRIFVSISIIAAAWLALTMSTIACEHERDGSLDSNIDTEDDVDVAPDGSTPDTGDPVGGGCADGALLYEPDTDTNTTVPDTNNDDEDSGEGDDSDDTGSGETSPDVWVDPDTGLTWQVNLIAPEKTWTEAVDYCQTLTWGGMTGWKLPNISELRTLIRGCQSTEGRGTCNVDERGCLGTDCRDAACSGCANGQGPANYCYMPEEMPFQHCVWYWSSSQVTDLLDRAWRIRFEIGSIDADHINNRREVRCVIPPMPQ